MQIRILFSLLPSAHLVQVHLMAVSVAIDVHHEDLARGPLHPQCFDSIHF